MKLSIRYKNVNGVETSNSTSTHSPPKLNTNTNNSNNSVNDDSAISNFNFISTSDFRLPTDDSSESLKIEAIKAIDRPSLRSVHANSFYFMDERKMLGPAVPVDYLPTSDESQIDKRPLFSFGVITDIQYADIDDGVSFTGVPRYYRHSFDVLCRGISKWNETPNCHFLIHLGDIIDGFCPRKDSEASIQKVLDEFDKFNGPTYHIIGNHCLYNLSRLKLNSFLNINSPFHENSFYEFSPGKGFRCIVLDSYDISLLGWNSGHPKTKMAEKILDEFNPNKDKNNPDGLIGTERRFVKFGGGVGEDQLIWFDSILQNAEKNGEIVFVFSHIPLCPSSLATGTCLLWNYKQVLDIISNYSCVVSSFSGHAHVGGYACDAFGVHHRVLEAAIECPPDFNAFGRVDVYEDRICLIGEDKMGSTQMLFPSRLKLANSNLSI